MTMFVARKVISHAITNHRLTAISKHIAQSQTRLGSYKKSQPVGDPSEYTDYEVIHNPEEWKYVERLLPKKWIPIPSPKESYPSGWTPPSADPANLPYFVERSKNYMLPVYLKIRQRGSQRETQIVKVEGDIWKLSEELVNHLKPLTGLKTIGCKVEEFKRKISLRGDFVEYTKKFLVDKGF